MSLKMGQLLEANIKQKGGYMHEHQFIIFFFFKKQYFVCIYTVLDLLQATADTELNSHIFLTIQSLRTVQNYVI